MKAKFDEQLQALREAIQQLNEEQNSLAEGIGSENPYLQTFLKYGVMEELDRSAVVDLVDTIYVHEGGEVDIIFKFRDQHKLIMEFIEINNQKAKIRGA